GGGLGGLLLDAEVLLGGQQAVVAGFVEGLVVPAAGVGDHAGLVVAAGAPGVASAAGSGGLLRGGAAGGEGQGAGADQGERTRDALHDGSFDSEAGTDRPRGVRGDSAVAV